MSAKRDKKNAIGRASANGIPSESAAKALSPSILAAGGMLALVFGGCCSNVYALESIINFESSSGTLLTFVQFVFVAVTGYIAQFDISQPPFFLTPAKVPLRRWAVNIVLFFAINVLNNHAFSYDISVPVHIILRSGGSITTMAAGYLYGKKYSQNQVISVIVLSIGVVLAAWSDASNKNSSGDSNTPAFGTGLVVLFVAQLLSAAMGLYTEETYKQYGPQWRENLFYCHILSLPLFLPFAPSMIRTFTKLANSPPLFTKSHLWVSGIILQRTPSQLIYLAANVLTQYACIRGVNLLAAASSALTVTIVLNIRKLISLLLSIWLFGNSLAVGTFIGAVLVFGAGALYTLDSKSRAKQSNLDSISKKTA